MIKFVELEIKELGDYNKLKKYINDSHIDSDVIGKLQKFVGTKCNSLLIEYPYYDSEYLSNYYVHYAQKFQKYDKACYRIHYQRDNKYYGFTVLRPTPETTKLGKTYLSPELVVSETAYLMKSEFKSHIHGQERLIECFPWKRQECDISCCAHTATWTVLKYFGNQYKAYCDTTIGEIVDKVKSNQERETPTRGLDPSQVSDIFKAYGFSPIYLENRDYYTFSDQILAYVESGLPIVGFLNIGSGNHAISIIGHGEVDYDLANDDMVDEMSGVILSTRLIKSIYVMDDRFYPYMKVTKSLPAQDDIVDYGMGQINYAIIPLYKRMMLTYNNVYARMVGWYNAGDFDFGVKPVCRIYLTSANSLKSKAMENNSMLAILRDIIISLSMPKFVWCIDFADVEQYKNHKTSGRIIIDATAATIDEEPWILKHDSHKMQYKDFDDLSESIYEIEDNIPPYDMYINNLKEVE